MRPLRLFIALTLFQMFSYSAIAQPDGYVGAQLLNNPSIFIPDEAVLSGLGGLVRVRVTIDENGIPTAIEQISGPGWTCPQITRPDVVAMRDAASKSAMLGKYSPATQHGNPKASSITLNFDFPAGESAGPNTVSSGSPDPAKDVLNGRAAATVTTETQSAYGPVIPVKWNNKLLAGKADSRSKPARQISGGVLNGKALSLIKPQWPAVSPGVDATVTVKVLIDTNGDVFSAETVSGHPLFRFPARSAACQSKFAPVTLTSSGEPVRVNGVIVYEFRKN